MNRTTVAYKEGELISESGDFVIKQVHVRDCRIITRKVISDSGESFENVQHCDQVETVKHPYSELSEEQLRPLAETDGAAALILAERLDKRMPAGSEIVDSLYVHALVLTGEEQVFTALFDHMTGGAGIVVTEAGLEISEFDSDARQWALLIAERRQAITGEAFE